MLAVGADVLHRVSGLDVQRNDWRSGGVHGRRKLDCVDRLNPCPGETILDVAGGTGDIALGILERSRGAGNIIVCDITESMMMVGRHRAINPAGLHGLDRLSRAPPRLPYPSARADATTLPSTSRH